MSECEDKDVCEGFGVMVPDDNTVYCAKFARKIVAEDDEAVNSELEAKDKRIEELEKSFTDLLDELQEVQEEDGSGMLCKLLREYGRY